MQIIKQINEILAFMLEIAMFVAVGYWGFQQGKTTFSKYAIALVLVAVAITLWGLFAAPNAAYRLNFPVRILFELTLFLIAAYLLYRSNYTNIAICFMILACLSETIAYVYKQ